jgi:hypothetical protein
MSTIAVGLAEVYGMIFLSSERLLLQGGDGLQVLDLLSGERHDFLKYTGGTIYTLCVDEASRTAFFPRRQAMMAVDLSALLPWR